MILACLTAAPVCLAVEFAIRSTANNKINARIEKVGELQAAIYAKIRLQGRLRALGRTASYFIPLGIFFAISRMYTWNHCTTYDNTVNIVVVFICIVGIQDLLNAGVQLAAILLAGQKSSSAAPSSSWRKLIMKMVMKEVLEIFLARKDSSSRVNPIDSNQSITGYTENAIRPGTALVPPTTETMASRPNSSLSPAPGQLASLSSQPETRLRPDGTVEEGKVRSEGDARLDRVSALHEKTMRGSGEFFQKRKAPASDPREELKGEEREDQDQDRKEEQEATPEKEEIVRAVVQCEPAGEKKGRSNSEEVLNAGEAVSNRNGAKSR